MVELWKADVTIVEWAKGSGHHCKIISRVREGVERKYICDRSCKLELLFCTWIDAKQWRYLEWYNDEIDETNDVND